MEEKDEIVIEKLDKDSSKEENNEKDKSEKKEIEENKNNKSFIENKENKKKPKLTFTEKFKQKTISFLKNKYNLAFLVVLFLALLIRLKYIGQESIWNDAAVHLWYAIKVTKEPLFLFSQQYLTGDYFTIQTLTAIFYLFTKNAFIAGKIVAILFGLVGIVFMYLLGTELKNKFVGLISAALLGFHHLFWFYGVRPLADAPLVTMIIITLYLIIKLEKEKKLFWGLFATASFLAVMATKGQGVLLFISFLIYLFVFKRKNAFNNLPLLVSWLIPLGIIVIGSLLLRKNFLAHVYNMFLNATGLEPQYAGLNAIKHLPWIFSWYLLVPLVLGILLTFLYRKKEYYFPLVFSLVYLIFFEVAIGTPEDRYILPLLPVGIILFVFFVEELGNYAKILIKKRVVIEAIILFLVFLLCWNFYNIGDPLIYNKSFSYRGHQEAGKWIQENVPENAIVFAGAPRMVRAFAEREFGGPEEWKRGGTLWNLRANRYLKNKSAFEKDLEELSKKNDIYLEIDIWEYEQPKWYWPITQESLNYFIGLGFQLVKVVEREVNTKQGLQRMPVIFLFKYVK